MSHHHHHHHHHDGSCCDHDHGHDHGHGHGGHHHGHSHGHGGHSHHHHHHREEEDSETQMIKMMRKMGTQTTIINPYMPLAFERCNQYVDGVDSDLIQKTTTRWQEGSKWYIFFDLFFKNVLCLFDHILYMIVLLFVVVAVQKLSFYALCVCVSIVFS